MPPLILVILSPPSLFFLLLSLLLFMCRKVLVDLGMKTGLQGVRRGKGVWQRCRQAGGFRV